MSEIKRKCKLCQKTLVSIWLLLINSRANGKKHHKDWNTREYHKKCYKLKDDTYEKAMDQLYEMAKKFDDDE